jgi:cation diffusion facilitator CzcD-associated flavoprotein CzcO
VRVVVVGGGRSGRSIERALMDRGATVELLSRSTGFDVLSADASARLATAEVIVEATGRFTTSRTVATDFFTRSTRTIAAAANASGAHHVLLSIVHCDRPEVQGYGYFAGKTAQERLARAASERLAIVRSTQWFEFAEQNLERMRRGRVALVPGMTIRPVALDAVAAAVAESALGSPSDATVEVCGPETTTLWRMTTALPSRSVIPVPLPIPGRLGRAFRDGALLPDQDTRVVGPRFDDWLASRP